MGSHPQYFLEIINLRYRKRWVRIGYPNIRMPNKPFHDRSLAGFSPEVAAMAAAGGAAAREGSAKARVADHISQAVQSTSNLLHLMQQSSPSQVRALLLLWWLSPFLFDLRFYGFWLVERSINFFFLCSFCAPDYVFCESDSVSCHGMKYRISYML